MIKVYNQNLELVAILENAFDISYEMKLNELWTAGFSLPADDPKNAECLPLRFVEIFDGTDRVDLFRIVPIKTTRDSDSIVKTYECEHVLATLLDDILFQYHETQGQTTAYNIQYILDRQTVDRWVLGDCDFTRYFWYSWENENLLGALFSIPKQFTDEFQWTFDTTSYPWTLSLKALSDDIQTYIRYGKNLRGITKTEDATNLCTRLYALGYGEGVNQLNLTEINPSGLPYLDADTQDQYGIITKVWVDRRYKLEDSLYNAAKAMLEELKTPYRSYEIESADIYQITQDSVDRFVLGSKVRTMDEELGEDVITRVIGLAKSDVSGNPGDIRITIANKPKDIAGSISDLADRARINEVYAQGATNLDSHDYEDNCDPDNPAVIKFYLPEETARINKMLLSFETLPFRAYSKGNEAKPVETVTSTTKAQQVLTSEPGTWYLDLDYYVTGDFMDTSGEHDHYFSDSGETFSVSGYTSSDGDHVHGLYPSHDHDVTIPSHSHNVTIPEHTHETIYGIYNGPTPTSVVIEVDGNPVSFSGTSGSDIDLIPYLSKDDEGRINRGTWHEIQIIPNDLGRIRANVVTQLFVQSRGGGNY